MKAVVLREKGGPKKLRVEEVQTPEPGPGQVRVAIKAAALNRRDLWITKGLYPGMQLPCIPGSDGAGTVDAVGQGADPGQIGREVVIYPALEWGDDPHCYGPDFRVLGMPDQGTLAEYICVDQQYIFPKPSHLDWVQSACLPVAGLTAWRSVVTQAEVSAGQRVLITGCGGGVASFALLWCLNIGADVYVSSGDNGKLEWARSLGATDGVNYRDQDCYKTLATRPGGFDVIIDSSGGNDLNQLLATLRPAGRYVFFGATRLNPENGLELARLFFRHIRLQGTTMGTPSEFAEMLQFVGQHAIEPVVHGIYPIARIEEACLLMQDYRQTGKIVISLAS